MNIRNLIGTLALTLNVCLAQAQQKTFTIAVLPDTQMYTEEEGERNRTLFESQTRWIVDNYRKENIVYVVHVGDIVNRGDDRPEQWENAFRALSILEQPLPGKPEGIPYGLAVGNHEQTPSQWAVTGKTEWFNHYFGVGHFEGRSYYGGHYGNDNDSHYDLFSAGGMDFIAIYIEYDAMDENIDALNDWAVNLCKQYPSRKAIIVSHGIIHYNPVEGTNDYRRDREGNVIVTRLNEAMCQEIAKEGKGIYVRVDNSNSAQRAINQEVNKMAKSDVESKVYTEFNEQFQAIAWVILLLLLAEILILDRKNPLFKNIHLFSNKK